MPGRTPTRTSICTYKGAGTLTLKGPTDLRGPAVQAAYAAAGTPTRTFKCTFIGHGPSVGPQVQLVMWPRGSHSSS